MTIVQLEVRVASLEGKLARLTERNDVALPDAMNSWIDQIHGTFQNDAAYRQAARFGREWRKSHRKTTASGGRKQTTNDRSRH